MTINMQLLLQLTIFFLLCMINFNVLEQYLFLMIAFNCFLVRAADFQEGHVSLKASINFFLHRIQGWWIKDIAGIHENICFSPHLSMYCKEDGQEEKFIGKISRKSLHIFIHKIFSSSYVEDLNWYKNLSCLLLKVKM